MPEQLDLFRPAENVGEISPTWQPSVPTSGGFEQQPPAAAPVGEALLPEAKQSGHVDFLGDEELNATEGVACRLGPVNHTELQLFAQVARVAELAAKFEEDDPEELAQMWPPAHQPS